MTTDELPYTIDEWSDDAERLIRYHARALTFAVAEAAFHAVCKDSPNARIAMRLGAGVMKERMATPWVPPAYPPVPPLP